MHCENSLHAAHTCPHRRVCMPRRPRLFTDELRLFYEPSRGAIQAGYLKTLVRKRARCFTNGKCVVTITDAGLYIRRGSTVRVQSLDVITEQHQRRQGHGLMVMTWAIRFLVRAARLPRPSPFLYSHEALSLAAFRRYHPLIVLLLVIFSHLAAL